MRAIARIFFRVWVRRYRIVGLEHIPSSGGAFLIANHTSAFDPVILGFAVDNRIMAGPGKIELFKNPVSRYILRAIGIFPLRPGEADAAAVRTMVDLYRAGRCVIVYPEGGRSDSGEIQEFIPGFARLVLKLQAPVIPAGIAGAQELLPIGGRIPRLGRPVVVAYGEPIDLSQFYGRHPAPEQVEGASQLMFDRVSALIQYARRERELLLRG
jgi:1-acyl-sn-glycerol-3-phosphate acyltransferase